MRMLGVLQNTGLKLTDFIIFCFFASFSKIDYGFNHLIQSANIIILLLSYRWWSLKVLRIEQDLGLQYFFLTFDTPAKNEIKIGILTQSKIKLLRLPQQDSYVRKLIWITLQYNMQLEKTLPQQQNQELQIFKVKQWENETNEDIVEQLKQTVIPSISFQKTKKDFNSSISEKINNYNNELKGYLMEKFDNSAYLIDSQNNSFLAKIRTQSSKNVPNYIFSKTNKQKVSKSVKILKPKSQSSIHQMPQITNVLSSNQLHQRRSVQDNQILTSLTKIVERTGKMVTLQGKHLNCSDCCNLEGRISKLQALVQTLIQGKTKERLKFKVVSLSQLKQGKEMSKKRFIMSCQKKKYLSLHIGDKQEAASNKKILKKVDITKISIKQLEEPKTKGSLKENKKPIYPLKKPNLKLNTGYHPIIEYNTKSSKKVIFRTQKTQNTIQKSHE